MLFRNRLPKLLENEVFSITEELDIPREQVVDETEEPDFQAQVLTEIQFLKDEIKKLGKAQLHITQMVEAYRELIDNITQKLLDKIDEMKVSDIKIESSEESKTSL